MAPSRAIALPIHSVRHPRRKKNKLQLAFIVVAVLVQVIVAYRYFFAADRSLPGKAEIRPPSASHGDSNGKSLANVDIWGDPLDAAANNTSISRLKGSGVQAELGATHSGNIAHEQAHQHTGGLVPTDPVTNGHEDALKQEPKAAKAAHAAVLGTR